MGRYKPYVIAIASAVVMALAFAHRYTTDVALQWALYDTQQALSLLLLSSWLFLYIHPKDSLMKAIALCWMLDSSKEVWDVWMDGNTNDWIGLTVQYAIISLIALPGLFSAWNVRRLQRRFSAPVDGCSVYVVVAPPQRFATWWHFTTGVSPGSMSLAVIHKGDALMFKFRRELTEVKAKVSQMHDHIFIPIRIDESLAGTIIREMRQRVGLRWSLFGNCSKVTFEVLYSMGVPRSRVTVLPIIPILKLCSDDPRGNKTTSNEDNR